MDLFQKKDYSVLLSNKVWPSVEQKLMAGFAPKSTMEANMKLILANTRSFLMAGTDMQNLVYLPKLVLPLVRRLFPKLIANQIIGTQPLDSSTGWIRFVDGYVTKLDGSVSNIYPFGPGDTEYSTPQTRVNDAVLANGSGNSATSFNGTLSQIPSEGTLYIEVATDNVALSAATAFTKIAMVDRGGMVKSLGSVGVIGAVDPKTRVYVLSFSAAPTHGIRFTYAKDIQKNIPFGSDRTYPMMSFDITKMAVEAKTRKLGATYSFELMEDYKNEFGEKFEDKIVDYMTTTMLTELDGEIITMLFNAATESISWDATQPLIWNRGISAWYETIMPKINKLSNTIFNKTHVKGASFILCNPVVATVFQSMQQYQGFGKPEDSNMEVGTVKLGSLSNSYTIYTSPFCPDNKILLGFKGTKPEETGAIYAPYVPVMLHPIYYAEGEPSVLARSRYWTGVVRPDYYGIVNVDGTI